MVQELVTQSWGSRIIGALWGVLIGLVLVVGSFVVVFWNEGHGLHTAQALQETEQVLVRLPTPTLDPKNNLQAVYFSGLATTSDVLQDSLLGVSQQAIMLFRTVEMYQWQQDAQTERQKQVGGSERELKTYSYKLVWSPTWIDSSQFKEPQGHQNPARMVIQSKTLQAKTVMVGDFRLPPDFVSKMQGSTMLDLSRLNLVPVQEKLRKPVQHNDYSLYVGKNIEVPEVGDLKITVSEILPQTVSVLAQQTGNTVQPYLAPAGQAVGLLVMGQKTPERMIEQAETENKIMTWVFRLVSFLMMFGGFSLILRPVVVLADVVPLFGSLVGFGVGLVAFTGGLCLWAVATGLAWFVVRPLWSVGLIVIALLLSYTLFAASEKRGS